MSPGMAVTLTALVTWQPEPKEYVITAVPTATPVTVPLTDPTLATTGLLLDQIPPPGAEVKTAVAPEHMLANPCD
jgi:hypothetical protein